MSAVSENNRRIAKNTLFLYFRQLLMMAVSLFTVRVVLSALGAEDYGIYNVVGGFVALFNVLSGALSAAISRFITFEMGRKDVTLFHLQRIFSSSVVMEVLLGLLVSALIVVAGLWFVEHKMVVSPDRIDTARYVLYLSSANFFISLLSVPYNALIIAHEQMKAFAYIGILDVCLRLGMACLLIVTDSDKLLVYAVCMVITALIVRSLYAVYCKRHFAESRFVWSFDRRLLRSMFTFSGWAFIGNGAVVLKDQGTTVLLNLFGGPVVNAAQGIAMQIKGAAYLFVSNFMTASNPQITKYCASGNWDSMHTLIIRSEKFGFFILLIILLPLCDNIEYVLRLWLADVPEHTASFVVLVLLYSLVECILSPLVIGVLAQGNIRNYEISMTLIYVINIAASYLCLKYGGAVESVFVINIFFKVTVLISLLLHARVKLAFPVNRFLKLCVRPSLTVFVVSGLFVYVLPNEDPVHFLSFLCRTVVTVLFTCAAVYAMGLSREERLYMNNILRKKIGSKWIRH